MNEKNKEFIEKAEKEISLIKAEIERINERKRKSIFDAMEVGDKAMVTSIKKPKVGIVGEILIKYHPFNISSNK